MSRHCFDTRYRDRDVQVALGYDRPLGHFFLTILFTESIESSAGEGFVPGNNRDEGDDIVVYSNLADPKAGFAQGLDYYRAKLAELGITVPESMFRETKEDALRRAGNRLVYHYEDGRVETIQDG